MKEESKAVIQDFLLRNSQPELIKCMEALVELEFPINDKYSFQQAMASCQDETTRTLMDNSFVASDFPILSAQSSLEKLVDKFQPIPFPLPSPFPFPFPFPIRPFPELPPDPGRTPSTCEVYYREFPRPAADCGCRAYSEAFRNGASHLQATLIGVNAAREYLRTGSCQADI